MDSRGRILSLASSEYEQHVSAHGWSEQRPATWWSAACEALVKVTDYARAHDLSIEAVAACGQMHGTVLIDDDGHLMRDAVPLWNDKRTLEYVNNFEASEDVDAWLQHTANPPTPAWPGFKLQWLRDHDREAWRRSTTVLMPKDFINFMLTGERAMDWTDAACSFLMNPSTGSWSPTVLEALDLDMSMLPEIRQPTDILGHVTASASRLTGINEGIPVLVGGGDYPVALLGSGVCRPGLASEVSGTSSIVTLVAEQPVLDARICNVGTAEGNWGAFVLLESGGDAARWARRVFHDNKLSYQEIVTLAKSATAGSDALFFLPFLVGERLGAHRNSRAQFFGLSAGHGLQHLHRAVLEGVGFAVNRYLKIMEQATDTRPDVLIASGGGAKADLWLQIKASIYDRPILIPKEPECGLVGCTILTSVATGATSDVASAASALVSYEREIKPEPEWVDKYHRMQAVFDRLYDQSQNMYDALDDCL